MTPAEIAAQRDLAAVLTTAARQFHDAADTAREQLHDADRQIVAEIRAAYEAGKPAPDTSALERRQDELLAEIRRLCAEGNARAVRAQFLTGCADRAEAVLAREHAAP